MDLALAPIHAVVSHVVVPLRTLTERVAKRISRGQPWGRSVIPDGLIAIWARQYAMVRINCRVKMSPLQPESGDMTSLSEWATKVKARDGKCVRCGTLEDLHAHHVKPKSSHPELMLDVSNGMALCYRCHKSEHEHNRPLRIRSYSPQKKTLQKRIAELEGEIEALKVVNRSLDIRVKMCADGVCKNGVNVDVLMGRK